MPAGRILRVKPGYNPNSSSVGSIIFSMSAAVIPATIAFGVVAAAISAAALRAIDRLGVPPWQEGIAPEPKGAADGP